MAADERLKRLFSLEGRVAAVTGASSGIGRRMALALAGAGAAVVAVARRLEGLEALVGDIEADGGHAAPHPVDLASIDDYDGLAQALSAPFGAPDILVNAAGINLRQAAGEVTLASWDLTLRINLTVPFFLARALVPGMRTRARGAIINLASLQSLRAFADSAPYGASKGGIAQLTRAMAEAWSRDGITVNAILPGFFPTELTRQVFSDPSRAEAHARATAIGRNGELADLDGATIFLAAPASAYITGQILPVDGGYTAK